MRTSKVRTKLGNISLFDVCLEVLSADMSE